MRRKLSYRVIENIHRHQRETIASIRKDVKNKKRMLFFKMRKFTE